MNKIEVLFNGWGENWVLGALADDGKNLLFEYSVEALTRGVELSPRHLKLQVQAYQSFPTHQHRLPGLIADALPDGWGMVLMDRLITKIGLDRRRISPLDRLGIIGDRAIGALSFRPATDIKLPLSDFTLLKLAKEAQQEIVGHDSEVLKELMLIGGSPHGARPKALVQYDEPTQIMNTLDSGKGEPWLIKFQALNEHKEVCAIEELYATMARACQLEMPRSQYFNLDSQFAGFGVQRFDRVNGLRVPVHTLAGFLNADFRVPSVDYETLLRATRLLTQSEREVQKAFERCVFNIIFNNRDDHAKNFSFRMNAQFTWELAPCYDLTFNHGPGGEHQMDVSGEGREPGKRHLLELASKNGLRIIWAKQVIERIAQVAGNFSVNAKNYAIRKNTQQSIARAIEINRTHMLD